ncbi:MAG: IS21 family transposase [Candidatus Dormiibacterota bacterium]
MRRIREVLRLRLGEGLSGRQVSAATGIPLTTAWDFVDRARRAGLQWPLPEEMDDDQLELRLFGLPLAVKTSSPARPLPDWSHIHKEIRRQGVTLQLLNFEYLEEHPDGYQYSQFCDLYRQWQKKLDPTMRQEHRAGEKMFPDFAGQTIPVVDARTGVVTEAQIFVGVLGASNYTYAEAFPSQELPHWIAGHVHAFNYFGGAPRVLVPDNLRSGVSKANRYEPVINATYADMAAHHGCVVIPARPRKPRDKAKVEVGVLIVERWILARLRNRTLFSFAELNAAIRELVEHLNRKPFKKLPGSRLSLFEEIERAALRRLPPTPYEFALWPKAKVSIDYHLEVDRHYYSVPHRYIGETCDVRLTAAVVEIFLRSRRIASHLRSYKRGGFTTDSSHMPESHRRHLEWTPSRIVSWGHKVGPATGEFAEGVLKSKPHPEQGFRSCLGIMRLGKQYGDDRLEAACKRALSARAFSYRSVESILKTGLDRQPLPEQPRVRPHPMHENVRGPNYYR